MLICRFTVWSSLKYYDRWMPIFISADVFDCPLPIIAMLCWFLCSLRFTDEFECVFGVRLIKINTMTKTEFNNVFGFGWQTNMPVYMPTWTKSNAAQPYLRSRFDMNGRLPTFLLLNTYAFHCHCYLFYPLTSHSVHHIYSTWCTANEEPTVAAHMICMRPRQSALPLLRTNQS